LPLIDIVADAHNPYVNFTATTPFGSSSYPVNVTDFAAVASAVVQVP
jgi:hypothetical protein